MMQSRFRRLACVAAALFLFAACWGSGVRAQDGSGGGFGTLFDAVVETTMRKFFDEQLLRQIDWRARAAAVRPSVLAATTPAEALRTINNLLADLKTSHTGLFGPDEYTYYILLDIVGAGGRRGSLPGRQFSGTDPYYPGTGAFTREVDGRHFVDAVLEGSPADRAGLKYGDEILSVDGMPYSPIAAFAGKAGRAVVLDIRRHAEDAPQRVSVDVTPIHPAAALADAIKASAHVIERDGRRIGYVHVWSVTDAGALLSALNAIEPGHSDDSSAMGAPLDYLIVDMRGRVGGTVTAANRYLEILDAAVNRYWGRARIVGRSGVSPAGEPRSFRGRSALLIDGSTRSAGEMVSYGFRRAGFGPAIGTTTAGALVTGATYVMPDAYLLYLATGKIYFDDGPVEGIGVAPDRRVERPLPYAAGADPVLDAALNLAAQ